MRIVGRIVKRMETNEQRRHKPGREPMQWMRLIVDGARQRILVLNNTEGRDEARIYV